MIKTIILEDESIAVQRLRKMLKNIDIDIKIIEVFEAVEELAEYCLAHDLPDLLILDIQVRDGLSFEIFDLVNIDCNVIFVTAYNEYAVKAFRKNAIDYLLKPLKQKQLEEALSKISRPNISNIKGMKNDMELYKSRFLIKFGAKYYSVLVKDIAYIYSENKITYFQLNDGNKIASDFNLKDLEKQLDPQFFFRANRQFIIHIDSIKELIIHSKSRVKLRLQPSYRDEIIVSTEKSPEFKNWLDR